jgi:SNF2 family DNA or RNA helicase
MESVKLDRAMEVYEELRENGHRVMFASQFREPLEELHRRIGDSSCMLHGGTPDDLRDKIKEDFDKSILGDKHPRWNSVLCNYKTGGVGLNLTGATAIIVLDEEWNNGKRDQAYARILRMGQDEAVQVHVLRVKGTTDMFMANLIDSKEAMVNGFNATMANIEDAFAITLDDIQDNDEDAA